MPDLLKAWDDFADSARQRNASHNTVYYAGKMGYYGQVILRDVNLLTTGGHGDVSTVAQELPDTIQTFTRITQGMLDGSPQLQLHGHHRLATCWCRCARSRCLNAKLAGSLNSLTPLVGLLVNVQKADGTIHDLSDQLLNNAQAINTSYEGSVNSRLTRPSVGYGLGLVGILLLVGILYLYVLGGDARRAAQMQLETNERNQQAICDSWTNSAHWPTATSPCR